jgi:ferredoxin
VSFHTALRNGASSVFLRIEEALDVPFGGTDNPLRHLGAIGLYLLWIVVGTGLYLYAVLDTGIDAVYQSIGYLSLEQWYLGGVLRSLHRYAADGFMLVMMLHLIREWCYGRYHGFRLYSWMTGIPLIWLAYAAGIGGYWIVWDQLAQLSAIATAELLDWLPIFSEPSARNFMSPDSISDRFFTMLVFIHIGVPLLLILGLWAHVHRISHVDYLPSRRAMLATLAILIGLALLKPALSNPPANLATVPGALDFDWFILFLHPLTDVSSPALVWSLLFGVTALLFALPLLPHPKPSPAAVVDPANCTGCDRCLADCPYAAIAMTQHPQPAGFQACRRRCRPLRWLRHLCRLLPFLDAFPPPGNPRHRHRHAAAAGQCAARTTRSCAGTTRRPDQDNHLCLHARCRSRTIGRRRHRGDRPDLHRHAATVLRRIRAAWRCRRGAGGDLPQWRL